MPWNILLISIALSIDALGIGVSYSLKGVSFPANSRIIIGMVSAGIMWGSMEAGEMLNQILPGTVTKIAGIGILALIGITFIKNSLFGAEEAIYDLDRSSKIDGKEAVILGFALSADSISAGIAISTIGFFNLYFPVAVGIMQIFFLSTGGYIVKHCKFIKRVDKRMCGVFSGVLLITIAILRGFS